MASKRTTHATDPSLLDIRDGAGIPRDPWDALMRTVPGDSPEESWDEKQERFGPLRDALEHDEILTPREVWVIEAIYWRQIGLRSVGKELSLSKTQVARIRDAALGKLYEALGGADGRG